MSKKVAVVTGANKGTGFAIVRELCKAKFTGDVILTARNEKLGNEAVKMLKSEGFDVSYHHLDICDQGSAKQLNDATETFGEQAEVTMRTNFWGTLWVCHALLPLLRPNARVVNVSSFVSKKALDTCSPQLQAKFRDTELSEEELCLLMGQFVIAAQQGNHQAQGWPNTAYGTTKIGVTVLSRIQAHFLTKTRAADGILLNACCPGWVRTDMAGSKAHKSPEEGAQTPTYLALLPDGMKEPHGQLVWDKTVQEW
ncbi:carbonyl reductase 1-like isoform X2 [Oncorhynchus kisutch]|uniref:carbonyl reductase 1-like isoform X2 n=1 Tax=Oncorhynchus kisutch TaxID=8019 RepID=UPI0012DF75C7|nr:carbonyl reductase [NADPH] 1-like isoform X2 [Oncorhynchus kisutch]